MIRGGSCRRGNHGGLGTASSDTGTTEDDGRGRPLLWLFFQRRCMVLLMLKRGGPSSSHAGTGNGTGRRRGMGMMIGSKGVMCCRSRMKGRTAGAGRTATGRKGRNGTATGGGCCFGRRDMTSQGWIHVFARVGGGCCRGLNATTTAFTGCQGRGQRGGRLRRRRSRCRYVGRRHCVWILSRSGMGVEMMKSTNFGLFLWTGRIDIYVPPQEECGLSRFLFSQSNGLVHKQLVMT